MPAKLAVNAVSHNGFRRTRINATNAVWAQACRVCVHSYYETCASYANTACVYDIVAFVLRACVGVGVGVGGCDCY